MDDGRGHGEVAAASGVALEHPVIATGCEARNAEDIARLRLAAAYDRVKLPLLGGALGRGLRALLELCLISRHALRFGAQ